MYLINQKYSSPCNINRGGFFYFFPDFMSVEILGFYNNCPALVLISTTVNLCVLQFINFPFATNYPFGR